MPFLRGDADASTASSASSLHELRSSKNLIGSSRSKCDVVVAETLDLHALLSLSADKSVGNLVPFSTSGDGICYLNNRVVPLEGVPVVHGDRLAFGNPRNGFIFELSPSLSSQTQTALARPDAKMATTSSTASFRRALDALRGDRGVTPHTSIDANRKPASKPTHTHAQPSKNESSRRSSSSSTSTSTSTKDQLGKFLLDASSDSLLSEYVERKLRQSASARKPRVAPMAMEPPPSLSSSTVSSMRSSLEDSILHRRAYMESRQQSSLSASATSANLDSFLSTAERNYAEIEKLRLSQQLREVNSVRPA